MGWTSDGPLYAIPRVDEATVLRVTDGAGTPDLDGPSAHAIDAGDTCPTCDGSGYGPDTATTGEPCPACLGDGTRTAAIRQALADADTALVAATYPPAPYTVYLPDRNSGVADVQRQAADPLGALRAYVEGWWDGGPMPYITGEHDLRIDPARLVAELLAADPFVAPEVLDLLECRQVPDEAPRAAHEGLGVRWALLIGGLMPRQVVEVMRERYGHGVTAAILAEAENARKGIVL